MPFYRRITAPNSRPVEAYRLPLAGKQPTDGLMFFLRENGLAMDALFDPDGEWIVKDPNAGVYYVGNTAFNATFAPIS